MLRRRLMAEGRDARYIMCTSVRILLAWQQFRHVQAVWQVLLLHLNLPPSPCQTERGLHLSQSSVNIKGAVSSGTKRSKMKKSLKIIQNQVRFVTTGHLTAVNDWLLIEFLLQTPHIIFQPWLTKKDLDLGAPFRHITSWKIPITVFLYLEILRFVATDCAASNLQPDETKGIKKALHSFLFHFTFHATKCYLSLLPKTLCFCLEERLCIKGEPLIHEPLGMLLFLASRLNNQPSYNYLYIYIFFSCTVV